jgi:large subunit ribosomal protein L3
MELKMSIGLVGRKSGMSRVFTVTGASVPVTVVEVLPNRVTQIKSVDNDGYAAIQVTTGSKKSSHVTKSAAGHFAKAGVDLGRGLWEFRSASAEIDKFTTGSELTVSSFIVGQMVDVSGVSKGKGFQGVIKRHHFSMQDATHGNSLSHRAPGSIGQNQSPGRVWKGKKMAGHMGDESVTIQNLQIVKIDTENNLLLIKGAVPGATGCDVIVTPAVKSKVMKSEG